MKALRWLAVCAALGWSGSGGLVVAQEPTEEAAETGQATLSEVEAPSGGGIVAEGLNQADTAWMLVSSALVLMMTAPGLALFYCGLVRKKNVLSVMMQCVFLMGLMSVVWALWGYSLAFGTSSIGSFERSTDDGGTEVVGGVIGGGDYLLLLNVMPEFKDGNAVYPMSDTIPALLFMAFQGMF
ncbi:MAG TPA: hypothetical protein VML55_14520, partial [Planctomycetaceae bacterium]|nr:hypothetical protein [Planctomycetaceae bacterium]